MTDPSTWLCRYIAAYRSLRALRRVARAAVNNAIRDGRLVRPTECSWCGANRAPGNPIEAHHASYRAPLDVRWLCRPCHRDVHRNPSSILPFMEAA